MRRNIDPKIKEAYLDWLMTPPAERVPKTKTAFSEKQNVHTSTLYVWENLPEFQEELRKLKAKWGIRWHGDILAKLFDTVMTAQATPSTAAAKVLLAHLDLTGPKSEEDELDEAALAKIRKALTKSGHKVVND